MRLSVQCFTLRESFAVDLWGTFSALADMGLQFVELAGLYGATATDLRNGLDRLGLKVSGSHVGLDRLQNDLEGVVEENRELRNEWVILPWIGRDVYGSGWAKVGVLIDPIAKRLRDAGLRFAYHNHSFEFETEAGRPGLDILWENSDPDLVFAQIDTAWVHHGGLDPASYIRKLGSRCPLVHLKDITDDAERLDIEAGKGVLDWDEILAACAEVNAEFGSIELDQPPQEPLVSVRESLEFFQSKGLR